MSTSLIDNLDYRATRFLDSRQGAATLAALRAVAESSVPDGFRAYCAETALWYEFNSSNTPDAATGRWRPLPTLTSEITDEENTVPSNKAVKEGLEDLNRTFKVNLIYGSYIGDDRIINYMSNSATNAAGYCLFKFINAAAAQFYGMWPNDALSNKNIAFFDKDRELLSVIKYEIKGGKSMNLDTLKELAPENTEFFGMNFTAKNPRVKAVYDNTPVDIRDNSSSSILYEVKVLKSRLDDLMSNVAPFLGQIRKREHIGYLTMSGFLREAGSSYHSYVSDPYPCRSGDRFMYMGYGFAEAASAVFYASLEEVNNKTSLEDLSFQVDARAGYVEVEVPEGANFVVFASIANLSNEIILDVKPVVNVINEADDKTIFSGNILNGKKWYCCGDSFSEGDYSTAPDPEKTVFSEGLYKGLKKVYSRFIAERNGIDLQLLAKCGATVGVWKDDNIESPSNTNNFYKNQFPKIAEDSDFTGYITLWFGINDSSRCYLGTIEDETLATFYGALNWSALNLITKFPLAHIGFIVSNQCNANNQQAVREVATKWGIPYLDLSSDPRIPTVSGDRKGLEPAVDPRVKELRWNNNFRVSSTNAHPNEKAQEYERTFIENWLRSL